MVYYYVSGGGHETEEQAGSWKSFSVNQEVRKLKENPSHRISQDFLKFPDLQVTYWYGIISKAPAKLRCVKNTQVVRKPGSTRNYSTDYSESQMFFFIII